MPYIVLRRVKFDRQYNIGDVIQDEVIEPDIARKLVRCGMIQDYTENEPKSANKQNVYELINTMKDYELLCLYEDTNLKKIIDAARENEVSEQEEIDKTNELFLSDSAIELDKIKALAESPQGNKIEPTNDDIQQIEVEQDNDNAESNDNKEVKKEKTSKSKKV